MTKSRIERPRVFRMLRKNIIHKSLSKPVLFVGCERLPFTIVVTVGGVLIMAYQTILVFILVLFYYLVSIMLIRRVNEHDPQFFRCLMRYLQFYQDFYPANEFYPGKPDKSYSFFD
ncbi:MAG: Type secretory pathway, VirB3-like protein [Pseudomonadota bacterium]|nr:Type secretory pathway, VirB3-like protein [Pseudomonadota bacterium]